jgi:glycosyltransferase involved in cell wall biosynthesis
LDVKTLWGLIKIIKQHNINIVNTHSGKDTWVGGLAAKFTGIKFIRTRHLSNPISRNRTNFINEIADYVITTGESVKQDMVQHNRVKAERIESIPTGIDETVFDPNRYDRAAMRQKFGIEEHEIAIGIIAILRGFKRHDLFIDMAKDLLSRHQNLKFIIAGNGPRHDEIVTRIQGYGLEKQVVLSGYLKEPAELLRALDIFVLSSDSGEGVPQAVMQALMMQVPVVATSAGSTADLHHNDNFVLIEPGKVEALIKGVEMLINTPQQRDHYRARAREEVVKRFGRKVMTEKLLAIYQKLLG